MPTCCAVGCSMRSNTNKLSKVSFFRFPKNDNKRRQLWINAIKRDNWVPTANSRLCSLHFVNGKPNEDSTHIDWCPTRFSHKQACNQKEKAAMERYERLQKRRQPFSLLSSYEENNVSHSNYEITCPEPNTAQSTIITSTRGCESDGQPTVKQFSLFNWKTEEKKLKFYTGLTNSSTFCALLDYILSFWKPSCNTLSEGDQLLLTLMKLRLGLLSQDLAYRFNVALSTVSKIIEEWLEILAIELLSLIHWPTKETIKKNLPLAFKRSKFRNVRCIIDCSEVFINRPKSFMARSQTFSSYKNHNTLKFIVAIAPSGAITFVSKFWGGRVSDKEITKKCGILDKLEPGDSVLADRGFQINELLAIKGVKIHIPAFTRGKAQLSRKEVDESRKISNVRIHVERAIGRLKNYRILSSVLPISLIKKKSNGDFCTADYILTVCCALVNLQNKILKG